MSADTRDPTAILLARLEAQREQWVELDEPPRRAVCLLRPRETEFGALRDGLGLDHVIKAAKGWRGFIEADLLGPADGGDFAVAWTPALFDAWLRDDVKSAGKLADALAHAVQSYVERKVAAKGN